MKMRERERERITTDDVFHNTCDSKQFEEPILSPYFHPRYSTTRIETIGRETRDFDRSVSDSCEVDETAKENRETLVVRR